MKNIYLLKRISTGLLLLLGISFNAFSYSWLYVSDPQSWEKSGQGSIDEVTITMEPKGIYTQYEMFITFSAAGHQFTANDTLEVSYYFTLPKGAIVNDSWLWVEDSIVHAKIMDRWSAYTIYENIVKRRRDPSVLYKDWQNNYQLRIFPMAGNSSRKVKISFLAPSSWVGDKVTSVIPLDLLTVSYVPLKKVNLQLLRADGWGKPQIPGFTGTKSYARTLDLPEKFVSMDIPSDYFNRNLQVSYKAPLKDGIYLNAFKEGDEGIYQMVFQPARALDIDNSRKILFLFDFEKDNSYNTDGNKVYAQLKTTLLNYLTNDDYFNIILSDAGMHPYSNTWIKADSASVKKVFDELGNEPVKDYSKLDQLLKRAIEFTKNNGAGEVLLLSNSDNFGENQEANELMESLDDIGPLPVFHVIDFNDRWEVGYYFGNQYFRGNQYFYTMLTRSTGGNYYEYNYWEQSEADILRQSVENMGGYLKSFDLYTTVNNGFCFSRYDINGNNGTVFLNKPIMQIGKFRGDMPFKIEASCIYDNQIKNTTINLGTSDISSIDSVSEQIWTGNFIGQLEEEWYYDNKIVQEIIDASLTERVLSRYTAFLALEPGMEVNLDPQNQNGPVAESWALDESASFGAPRANEPVTNEKNIVRNDEVELRAFPNPFDDYVHIQVSLPRDLEWRRLQVEIYNMMGQKVKAFTPDDFIYNGLVNIEWDGTDDRGKLLNTGAYVLVIKGEQFRKNIRLLRFD